MLKRVKENRMVFGLHSIIEAIDAGRDIEKIYIKRTLNSDLAKELLFRAKELAIPVQRVPIEKLGAFTEKNHQGAVAFVSEIKYQNIADIIPLLYEQGKTPFVVALDGVTDVRNFGAISRTCECAGVDAIVIPSAKSAGINADAIKTSAGALHNIPICRVDNFVDTIKFLQNSGLKAVALSEKAKKSYTEEKYNSPLVIILGSEDMGINKEVLDICDSKVQIPILGNIQSLNVSVAAGIAIYEVRRQLQ